MSLLLALDRAGTGGRFGLHPSTLEIQSLSQSLGFMDELRQTTGMTTQGPLWGLRLIWGTETRPFC